MTTTLGALLDAEKRPLWMEAIHAGAAELHRPDPETVEPLFSTDPSAEARHKPQPGPQEVFMRTTADIAIYGGEAGGGKSWCLLAEPLQDVENPHLGMVIFRRTSKQVKNEGGLWDESEAMYPDFGATSNRTDLQWSFPSGGSVTFAHLEHEKNKIDWQGAQIPVIGFDELTHFLEAQFWYLTSRNRSKHSIRKRIRATTNPTPEDDPVGGWVARLIAWWIDQREEITDPSGEKVKNPAYGLPIAERSGRLRWFVRIKGDLVWADSREELERQFPSAMPRSLTFIHARLSDNRILEEADPEYRAALEALPLVERERLLGGNWKARGEAGKYFNEAWFSPERFMDRPPRQGVAARIRYWDKAGTEGGSGARSAGVLLSLLADGRFVVEDAIYGRWGPLERDQKIRLTAETDPPGTVIWVEQEPGSGGKESAQTSVRSLAGHEVRVDHVHDPKHVRWGPWSSQVEGGNVWLTRGDWNREYIKEHHNADPEKDVTVDMVDASSGACAKLVNRPRTMKPRPSQTYFSR